jgi:hypothetical protein
MATFTALDLINKALQKVGILAEGETATAPQANDAFDALNNMLDSWAGRSLLTQAQIRESFPLTAWQSTYSIGPSVLAPNFITSKPIEIVSAFVRDNLNLDSVIDIVSRQVYDSYPGKAMMTISSRPEVLFYDPGVTQQANQAGTIHIYPTPDASTIYTLYMESEKPFAEFTSLTDIFIFPPAYKRAIIYNLAVELGPDYGRAITAEVQNIAFESMRIIENLNSRNKKVVAAFDFPSKQKAYNIYTDV